MRLHAVPAGATSGFMCMRARTCVYVSTCVCMYVDLSVCLSVCIYVYMYVCMHVFVSLCRSSSQRTNATSDLLLMHYILVIYCLLLFLSCSLTYPLLFLTVIPHVVEFFFPPRPQLLHGDETEDTNNHLSASFSVSLSLSFCTFFDSDACSLLFGCIFAFQVKSRVGGNDAASTKTTDRIFRFCLFPCVFLLFSSSTIAHFRLRSRCKRARIWYFLAAISAGNSRRCTSLRACFLSFFLFVLFFLAFYIRIYIIFHERFYGLSHCVLYVLELCFVSGTRYRRKKEVAGKRVREERPS